MDHGQASAWVCSAEDGHVSVDPQIGHHCCFCLNVRSPARKPKTIAAVVVMSSATATPFLLLTDGMSVEPSSRQGSTGAAFHSSH
jgi:hypothetical protein